MRQADWEWFITLVAPFAGAWIEISWYAQFTIWESVAPFAGAWIEIMGDLTVVFKAIVAPFAGAWIEIGTYGDTSSYRYGRSLRGSVD